MNACFIENAAEVSGINKVLFTSLTGKEYTRYITHEVVNAWDPINERKLIEVIEKCDHVWCATSLIGVTSPDLFTKLLGLAIDRKMAHKRVFNMEPRDVVCIRSHQRILMDYLAECQDVEFLFYDDLREYFNKHKL